MILLILFLTKTFEMLIIILPYGYLLYVYYVCRSRKMTHMHVYTYRELYV